MFSMTMFDLFWKPEERRLGNEVRQEDREDRFSRHREEFVDKD